MTHIDLPEPKRQSLTQDEVLRRHWHLISTFVVFVAAYAVLHKLIIPFFLKFTSVTKTPYSKIDPFFVHPVLLAFFLSKNKKNNLVISFLCGFGVVYGLSEVTHTFLGKYDGWLAVSRLLSAVPLAIASGYVMSQPSDQRSFRTAWLGALIGGSLFLLSVFPKQEILKEPDRVAVEEGPHRGYVEVNQECGNSEILIHLNQDHVRSSEVIIQDGCGITPSVLRPNQDTLTIANQKKIPINIHLMVFERGKESSRWNMLIPPGVKLQSPKLPLETAELGVLYSDNIPAIGIVGLVFKDHKSEKRFHASRSPLKIEELP